MKKLYILIIVLGAFLYPFTIYSSDLGKIEGEVIDKESGNPLILANVLIKGTSLGSATNVDGKYFIYNIKPGDYHVMATVMGYAAATKKVTSCTGANS